MRITKRKPPTPGEILTEECLKPVGMSQDVFAQVSGLPVEKVAELCAGRLKVTAEIADKIASVFGTTAQFWLNMQKGSDDWAKWMEDAEMVMERDKDALNGSLPAKEKLATEHFFRAAP